VLAYDEKVPLLDDDGNPVTRWDGETMKRHPVTGEDVPDDSARMPVYRYVNPRKAEWPEAEFIVGNPPFIGNWRLRAALGDSYVQSLRSAHSEVPESVDYVLYWWQTAAGIVSTGRARRFGLITTNSLRQTLSRRVIQAFLEGTPPLSVVYAIPDHPWIDSADGAAVRIAMTVAAAGHEMGTVATVAEERMGVEDVPEITFAVKSGFVNSDLTIGADITGVHPLRSNGSLSSPGVKLHGAGFIVTTEEAIQLGLGRVRGLENHIRPYRHGKDLMATPRGVLVIDLDGMRIGDVESRFPEVYQWIHDRVKPERDQNNERYRRENWWLFGRKNTELRRALLNLPRYISTPETSKHRCFFFLGADVLPDNMLVNFGLSDAFELGVLSSSIHVTWALAAGGTLEDRPRYNKTVCFDPFPFPEAKKDIAQRVRGLGERLDAHRKRQQALHPELTITGMYNVLEKLRSGEALTEKEKVIHEQGLVSVLKQIHDDLDAAVFDAYGWPHDLTDEQILERLVALNAERAEEERRGIIRWLRPEFQNPAGAKSEQQTTMAGIEIEEKEAEAKPKAAIPWPKDLPSQIAAVRDLISSNPKDAWSLDRTAKAFKGAKRAQVQSVLDSLAALGLLVTFSEESNRQWTPGK
jgi:hypothetical protein